MYKIILTISLCVGIWSYAQAETVTLIPGADSASVVSSGTIKCYAYSKYFIIESLIPDSVGSNILVKYTAPGNVGCSYNPEKGDFEIKNEWAEYFSGISGDKLFVDSGTGPERVLIIYDLKKRISVFSSDYSEPIEIKKNRVLSFWAQSSEGTPANCPEFETYKESGLGAAIETKVEFNLKTQKLEKSKETRCSSRQ